MRNLSWMVRSKNGMTTWSDNLAVQTGLQESNLVQDQGGFFSKLFFLKLVSKELNHLAAILHVYAGSLIFMK